MTTAKEVIKEIGITECPKCREKGDKPYIGKWYYCEFCKDYIPIPAQNNTNKKK